MSCCILCLVTIPETIENIQIHSAKGRKLRLLSIIEQHFPWLKNNAIHKSCSQICQSCWRVLSTFQEFYLQIKNAHKLLECDIKAIDTCLYVESEEQIGLVQAETENKEDVLSTNEIKVEQETKASELLKSNCKLIPIVNDEILDVVKVAVTSKNVYNKPMDTNDITKKKTSSRNKLAPTAVMKPCLDISKKKQTTRNEYEQKLVISEKFDDYIANHFRLSCCLCNIPVDNFSTLMRHFRDKHHTRGYVKCCGKKLLKRGVLVDHLRTHEDPSYFKCSHCDKILTSRRCLEVHLNNCNRIHSVRERIYECKICFKKYAIKSIFDRHMLNHAPEDMKTIPCPECEKTFVAKYIMSQHLRLVHLNTYVQICDICGKSIVGQNALRRHLDKHTDAPRPPGEKCDMCDATLATKRGLTRHKQYMHSEEHRQPQVCPTCSKVLIGSRALRDHIYNMHSIEPKYPCTICGKPFKRAKQMKEHMSKHTGELQHKCQYCPKAFTSSGNLNFHMKKVHLEEWQKTQKVNKLLRCNTKNTSNIDNMEMIK